MEGSNIKEEYIYEAMNKSVGPGSSEVRQVYIINKIIQKCVKKGNFLLHLL